MNTQWFRDRLADKRLSQRRLAKMLELDPAAVSLMFRGMRRITPHEAHQISTILGVPLNEVMRNAGIEVTEDVRRCPVAAHVDENGVVTSMPPRTHDDVIGPADCPFGTFAIQVRSHSSTKDGWLLFVTPAQVKPAENIDQLCLVATGDGRQVLAVVRRGYRKDTHNLIIWPSNEMISDASIVWTSTVLWIKPLY
jgi:transcriptional regulator with XRE-family HTH domain